MGESFPFPEVVFSNCVNPGFFLGGGGGGYKLMYTHSEDEYQLQVSNFILKK